VNLQPLSRDTGPNWAEFLWLLLQQQQKQAWVEDKEEVINSLKASYIHQGDMEAALQKGKE